MGVHLPRASSSLRLGSRIVPRTPSSLGKKLAILWTFLERTRWCVDLSSRIRLTHLRGVLVAGRLEKSSLANEIASCDTTPARKQWAIRRYSSLAKELQMTARELEVFLAATKEAEQPRRFN